MFTAREDFGVDATAFCNHLTGYMKTPVWKRIVTAPKGMKERFVELIENEIEKSTPENPGRILAKMNSLTDKVIIKKLFEASCAGVQIDLIVRGVCYLRPGIPGVSENIRVFSIVGRFLEHSRIFYLKNGGDKQIYLSSADWMTRNMEKRVEILFPVVQENLKERVKKILNTYAYEYDVAGNQTTSLQYLRARWYDPAQGRFLTEDTYEGNWNRHLA